MRVGPTRSADSHRAQHLIAALVPALIITLSITGFVWAQKEVTVVVDGRTSRVRTQAASVEALLDEIGIDVDADDLVTPALDTPLGDCTSVVVRRSIPVTVNLDGRRVDIDVVGDTVADALVAVGADPASNSQVIPPPETPLRAGMTVSVPHVFVRVSSQEVTVAAPVRYEKDPSLPRGVRRVVASGEAGRKLLVYRVLVAGGAESVPELANSRTIRRAVPRIVAVGTGSRVRHDASSRSASAKPPREGRRMRVETTAYSPRQPDLDFTTATGARARYGIIAVDPRTIPLGTRVYVPGYGYALAADTGGAIKGNRIDLCFETVQEAIRWGRRSVTIIVLD